MARVRSISIQVIDSSLDVARFGSAVLRAIERQGLLPRVAGLTTLPQSTWCQLIAFSASAARGEEPRARAGRRRGLPQDLAERLRAGTGPARFRLRGGPAR